MPNCRYQYQTVMLPDEPPDNLWSLFSQEDGWEPLPRSNWSTTFEKTALQQIYQKFAHVSCSKSIHRTFLNLFAPIVFLDMVGSGVQYVFWNRSLTEFTAYRDNPLPQRYMVSLRKEVFRSDPWGLIIVYTNSEHEKEHVTAYRLAELEFKDQEEEFYIKHLSRKLLYDFSFLCR